MGYGPCLASVCAIPGHNFVQQDACDLNKGDGIVNHSDWRIDAGGGSYASRGRQAEFTWADKSKQLKYIKPGDGF
jgi:hypothetical protein